MEEVDKEISEMKLSLNARARIVAESYLTAVSLTFILAINPSSEYNCSSMRSTCLLVSNEIVIISVQFKFIRDVDTLCD